MSSYDFKARRPVAGSIWVWEPTQPAAALIMVERVLWNGEEWWIGTSTILDTRLPQPLRLNPELDWNDLSRFWEACHAVATDPGPPRGRSIAVTSGPPSPEEMGPGT